MTAAHLDTSVLAKRYFAEADADGWNNLLVQFNRLDVSRLAALELKAIVARRRRAGGLAAAVERSIWRTFLEDVASGQVHILPVDDSQIADALSALDRLASHGVGAIDTVHLIVAIRSRAAIFLTADRAQGAAAMHLGLPVRTAP